jgi:hypothetical protein
MDAVVSYPEKPASTRVYYASTRVYYAPENGSFLIKFADYASQIKKIY